MSTLKKIIDWVKSRSVILWILKVLFALLIGAISFSIANAIFNAHTGGLLAFAILYTYLGYQIANHTKASNKESMIFAWILIILMFLAIFAGILGFIFINKAFGWSAIILSMFSLSYYILRAVTEANREEKEKLTRFSSTTE